MGLLSLSFSWHSKESWTTYLSGLLKIALGGGMFETLDVLVQQALLLDEFAHGCRSELRSVRVAVGAEQLSEPAPEGTD